MMSDPLAMFRGAPPERRKPQVFVVGRRNDIRDWEQTARLADPVTRVTAYADTVDLRFQADDVLVFMVGWERLVDAEAIVDGLDAARGLSTHPKEVRL